MSLKSHQNWKNSRGWENLNKYIKYVNISNIYFIALFSMCAKIWKVEQKHPLLLNGANVPDNLIEKEIPPKIPPHSPLTIENLWSIKKASWYFFLCIIWFVFDVGMSRGVINYSLIVSKVWDCPFLMPFVYTECIHELYIC